MKIAIAAGGRFHAFHLAHQLYKRKSLKKLFTFSYTKADNVLLPFELVRNVFSCSCLDQLYLKFRFSHFVSSSSYNVFKDNIFDTLISKEIFKLKQIDIFVGWAHYILKSIPEIRKLEAKIILESGSCHIFEQQKLLVHEYEKYGIPFFPIHPKNREKMVQEYHEADYIMTLSSFAYKSFLQQKISKKKLLKVPCGMDVEFFLKAVEGNKKSLFRVIFVGMLNLRKGIHYLIEAWNKANLPEQSTELMLVGNLQKDLKMLLPLLPIKKNVVFYGSTNRENLRRLYQSSSVFVLPSVEDGFGMVMGEAMASGLPVICTDHTGGTEIIENGKEGFIVPARDNNELAEKILLLHDDKDLRMAMGIAGHKKIKGFSWGVYGEKVYDMYKKILKCR
jgi:glycosyltransferase involved in cell wall biosynthesis